MLFLALAAGASEPQPGTYEVDGIGRVSRWQGETFCQLPIVVVGTITHVDSFEVDHDLGNGKVNTVANSKITVTIEADILDSVGPKLTFQVAGGKVGSRSLRASHSPAPQLGMRYAFGLRRAPKTTQRFLKGEPQLFVWSWVDSAAELPPEGEIRMGFQEFCDAL